MKFELVIDSKPTEVVIALLKEGRLIELHKEKHDNNYSVGDIYLGKIKKIVPGLNAAFVGVGHEKDGFLHYLDLGSQLNSFKKFTDKTRTKKLNTASLKNFKRDLRKETNLLSLMIKVLIKMLRINKMDLDRNKKFLLIL